MILGALAALLIFIGSVQQAQANLLSHSSFEVPGNNHWGARGVEFTESHLSEDAYHGHRSLKWPFTTLASQSLLKDAQGQSVGQHFYQLYYQPVEAQEGQVYTFSAYAKLDTGSNASSLKLSILDADRNSRAVLHSASHPLTAEWQRYSLTTALAASNLPGRYVLEASFTGIPPWTSPYPTISPHRGLIDAVSFAPGSISPYDPGAPIEVGIYVDRAANLFHWGESLTATLYVANMTTTEITLPLNVNVVGHGETTPVDVQMISLTLPSKACVTTPLSFPSNLRGHFSILVDDGDTVLAEKIFSVVPPAKSVPFEDSIFGADMSLTPYMLAVNAALGMTGARPHSETKVSVNQPTEGVFSWARTDEAIANANAAGIQLYGFFYGLPAWMDAGRNEVPDDMEKWRDHITAVVTRYKDDIKYWEILNEPCKHSPSIPSADYLDMVRVAHEAATAVDPNARIFGYGPATCYQDIAIELSQYMALVSDHRYPTRSIVTGTALRDRLIASSILGGVPGEIWNTEGGATGGGVQYRTHSAYDPLDGRNDGHLNLAKAWAHQKSVGSKLFYYWQQCAPPRIDHTPAWNWSWTLCDYDGSLKSGSVTTAVAAHYLDGANIQFRKIIYDGSPGANHMTAFHFSAGPNESIVVAWVDHTALRVELRNPQLDSATEVISVFGAQVADYQPGDALSHTIGHAPVYIRVSGKPHAEVDASYLQQGVVSSTNPTILISQGVGSAVSDKVDVLIVGGMGDRPGLGCELFQQVVSSPSVVQFPWDAPVHESDDNTLVLLPFTRGKVEKDLSSYDRQVTVSGLEYGDSYGKFAGGLKAPGGSSDRHVLIPSSTDFDNLTQFTIEMWVMAEGGGHVRLVQRGDRSPATDVDLPFSASIRETGSELYFRVTSDTQTLRRQGVPFPSGDGLYHHLAYVFDGTPPTQENRRMDIYLDGQLVNAKLSCTGGPINPSPSCPVPDHARASNEAVYVLGYELGGPVTLLDGFVDEFVMYDRALSSQEILEHARLKEGVVYFWQIYTQQQSVVVSETAGE